jgi:hypothetical protein
MVRTDEVRRTGSEHLREQREVRMVRRKTIATVKEGD